MASPIIILKTAPNEIPYGEIVLTDRVIVTSASPDFHDIEVDDFFGNERVIKLSARRKFDVRLDDLTVDEMLKIDDWSYGRRKLRINGNYNAKTIFYQCFQRRNPHGNKIGTQIGTEPTFLCDTAGDGTATELNSAGVIIPIANNIPRYGDSAYGMRGIMLENQTLQQFTESHPESGDLRWALLAGAPTLNWLTDIKENYLGEGGALRVNGANPDAVFYDASAGALSRGTLSVWLTGQGSVVFEAYDQTGGSPITNVIVPLNHENEWRKYSLEDLDLTGVTTLRAKITMSVGIPTTVYIGQVQLEGNHYANSIVNTDTVIRFKEFDSMQLTPLKGLSNAASFTACFKMPSSVGTQKRWLANNVQNLEFYFDPATDKFYFQKKTSAFKVEYVTTASPGDDMIVTAEYDFGNMTIYENGVSKNNIAHIVGHTTDNNIFVGSDLNDLAFGEPLAWFRIDEDKLNLGAHQQINSMYADPESRIWTLRNEGRDFRIKRIQSAVRVTPEKFKARLRLEEVESNMQATIEER